jgi:UDP-4-amino-4-deoxy-L-arabinose-oxoglutarate aminotransferase
MQALKDENVGCGIHFRSLHLQHYYKNRFNFKLENLPNAAFISERILSLPLYPGLNFNEVILVAKIVKKLVDFYRT